MKFLVLMLFAILSSFAKQTEAKYFLKLDTTKPDEATKLKFLHCNSSKGGESSIYCSFLCSADSSCIAFDFKSPVCKFCMFVFNSTPHQVQGELYVREGPDNPTSGKKIYLFKRISFRRTFNLFTWATDYLHFLYIITSKF